MVAAWRLQGGYQCAISLVLVRANSYCDDSLAVLRSRVYLDIMKVQRLICASTLSFNHCLCLCCDFFGKHHVLHLDEVRFSPSIIQLRHHIDNVNRSADAQRSTSIKLRAACNQCHDSKVGFTPSATRRGWEHELTRNVQVRCSGERLGCKRCQTLGCECIYEESRVGKVQGNRGRKRKLRLEAEQQQREQQQGQQPEHQQQQATPPGEQQLEDTASRTSRSLSVAVTPLSSLASSADEDQAMSGVQDDDLPAPWADSLDAPFASDMLAAAGPEDCSFFTGFEEFSGRSALYGAPQPPLPPTMADLAALNDFDTREPGNPGSTGGCFPPVTTAVYPDAHAVLEAMSPGGSGGQQQRNRSTQLQHHRGQHSKSYDRSDISINFLLPHQAADRWLVECVRMADELERFINIRLSAADEVMRINKSMINKINNVLEFEEFTPSVSLLGLTCLTLSHVVTLYELAAEALTSKGTPPRGLLPPNATSFSSFDHLDRRPAIHFGNFCLDSEEHQAIQEQIFLKELQRCSRAAAKLSARLGFDHADGGRLQNVYATWHTDLISRVEKVQTVIKKED